MKNTFTIYFTKLMNKKTSNSIALLLSLIVVLVFSACNQNNQETKTASAPVNNGKIAFVRMDSLVVNYYLAKEINEAFQETQKGYNKEFGAKKQKFTEDAQAFQAKLQRGGFLTETSARKERDRILAMEQEVKKMDYELSAKLQKIQAENNQRVLDSLNAVLDRFQDAQHYKYILDGAAVLRTEGGDNITSEILDILNGSQKK
ncbi:OmpH family outer membrane protein [Halosquirtibacter xylanolyticus]|uniref:OmpH family outer membrane protein n=1 Tax=Halosquirtibacter xylanolyticus TaxID=3374599 RepID=UPI00374A66BD|nr:OmpH family outer membrane protein [Prolixibacteraceae bacterium]